MPCIESEAESDHLYELAGASRNCCGFQDQSCCVWTGLTQSVTNQGSAYGWDGWDSSACHSALQLWNTGEPNDYSGGDENCATLGLYGAKKWFDAPCAMQSACVCEVRLASADASPEPPPPPPLPPPPPPPPSNCADGWHPAPAEIDLPDKCYKVLVERLDAQACRNRCRAEQGVDGDGKQTLAAVCVGSSVENIFVADLVGVHKDCCSYQDQSCCPWLGLQQSITSMGAAAHWDLWDADCSSRYTNWNEGEPNDDPQTGGDENCVCLSAEGDDHTWFDVPCEMPAACVCEYGGSPPPCPHSEGGTDGGIGGGAVFLLLLLFSLVAGAAGYYEGKDARLSRRAKELLGRARVVVGVAANAAPAPPRMSMSSPRPEEAGRRQSLTPSFDATPYVVPSEYLAASRPLERARVPLAAADSATAASLSWLPMATATALPAEPMLSATVLPAGSAMVLADVDVVPATPELN